MQKIFADFDFTNFWDDDEYARKNYTEPTPSDELIAEIEQEIGGYKLPASYIELMKMHNGGTPANTCYPVENSNQPIDYVVIKGIMGIGREKTYSLCGDIGNNFMIEEWEYPRIGVCICNCPSAGHDMIMLDYSKCGPQGEPEVVHVDQELDYEITFLAKDFETFIRGLVHEDVYDTSEEDLKKKLQDIENGSFSDLLNDLVKQQKTLNYEAILRNLCKKLALEKGYFALHADELSYLVYDVQFLLYSKANDIDKTSDYLAVYPRMIALPAGNPQFTTGGYAPGFIEDWLQDRLDKGYIKKQLFGRFKFTDAFEKELIEKISEYQTIEVNTEVEAAPQPQAETPRETPTPVLNQDTPATKEPFADFDFTDFWDDDAHAQEDYLEPYPTDELIADIEEELGFKLPASYIKLMRTQNGGFPRRNCYQTEDNEGSEEYTQISGIMGIGRDKDYSLCGKLGSTFFTDEGGYPDIGICICDTPSAGHDMIMLDYRKCGKNGEPEVVQVWQEDDYSIHFLAKDFETFIRGLKYEDEFYEEEDEDEDYDEFNDLDEDDQATQLDMELKYLQEATLSPMLLKVVSLQKSDEYYDRVIRHIAQAIAREKGTFDIQDDELSYLMLDTFYMLCIRSFIFENKKQILKYIPQFVGDTRAAFRTRIYRYQPYENWLEDRIKKKIINGSWFFGDYKMEKRYQSLLLDKLKKYE